jgi:hypothetical protein
MLLHAHYSETAGGDICRANHMPRTIIGANTTATTGICVIDTNAGPGQKPPSPPNSPGDDDAAVGYSGIFTSVTDGYGDCLCFHKRFITFSGLMDRRLSVAHATLETSNRKLL